MKEVVFGEEIRRLRLAKGWSQERLADGICSPSTLSRIENGCQVPSRRVFRLLMEHLEGPGTFSYAHFLGEQAYQREKIQEEILEAMETWQVDRVKDLLWELEHVTNVENPKESQFYEMSKEVCYQMCGAESEGYATKCVEILQIGRPDWNGEEKEEWVKASLGVMRGRIDVVKSDYVEFWILNNLAVGFMWQKKYEEAYRIFVFLFSQLEDDKYVRKRSWKMRGILLGNMALCLLYMGRPRDAKACLKRAVICVQQEGGVLLCMHLLRIEMDVSLALKDQESYYQEELLHHTLQRILPKVEKQEMLEAELQWGKKEFLIL